MKLKDVFDKAIFLIVLMIFLQGCTRGYMYFINEKMSFSTINLLFISFAILSIVLPIIGKKRYANNKGKLMEVLYLFGIISAIIVMFLCVPFLASFSDIEFLEHTTRYTSGSMDGYESNFWGPLFLYCFFWIYIIEG